MMQITQASMKSLIKKWIDSKITLFYPENVKFDLFNNNVAAEVASLTLHYSLFWWLYMTNRAEIVMTFDR